jgi:hypothetical protein
MRNCLPGKEMFVPVRNPPAAPAAQCCTCETAPFMFVSVRIAPKRKILKN